MRLSFEALHNETKKMRPKAQARWFLLHFGVEVAYDKHGPILTEASFEKLIERKLGLGLSSEEDKPRPQPVPTRHLAAK